MDSQLLYKVAMTMISGVGIVNARSLLKACGSPEAIFAQGHQKLLSIHGIGPQITNQLKEKSKILEQAKNELERLKKEKISCTFFTDESFPRRLSRCSGSPLMLFTKGVNSLSNERVIAIVGTRKPSEYGKKMTQEIIQGLATVKPLIISGLAYGVDTCCHQQCVNSQVPTAAVLGHGFQFLYPPLNRKLAKKMLEQEGMLISQFPFDTKPDREHFPMRNRVIAGLADAVLVIESDRKGGSMITARITQSIKRDLFALPGPANLVTSRGCNLLIKEGKAKLIESAGDIIKEMSWDPEAHKAKQIQRNLFAEMDETEKTLATAFDKDKPTHRDQISFRSELSPGKISMTLLSLEMKGLLRTLPGNFYELLN